MSSNSRNNNTPSRGNDLSANRDRERQPGQRSTPTTTNTGTTDNASGLPDIDQAFAIAQDDTKDLPAYYADRAPLGAPMTGGVGPSHSYSESYCNVFGPATEEEMATWVSDPSFGVPANGNSYYANLPSQPPSYDDATTTGGWPSLDDNRTAGTATDAVAATTGLDQEAYTSYYSSLSPAAFNRIDVSTLSREEYTAYQIAARTRAQATDRSSQS
ncbi:hypothetical protein Q5752_005010 [Cryptotrichosporon argae]